MYIGDHSVRGRYPGLSSPALSLTGHTVRIVLLVLSSALL